jgi:hypothetical protein
MKVNILLNADRTCPWSQSYKLFKVNLLTYVLQGNFSVIQKNVSSNETI